MSNTRASASILSRSLAFFLLLSMGSGIAAEDLSWKNLEQGKILYSQKKFGEALLVFNRAVSERNEGSRRNVEILDSVLATRQAKRAGDSIDRLISYFAADDLRSGEIDRINAESGDSLSRKISAYEKIRISDPFQNLIDVLQAGLDFRSQEYFRDSLSELREFIKLRRFFPEAEYWIAKIFLAEGEYEVAQKQLEKAIGYSDSLDVPDFIFEIRYLLAEIFKTYRTYGTKKDHLADMEAQYKAILAQDALYSKESQKSLREAMNRSLKANGIDKFLTLYRHDAFFAARAYSVLGEFFYKSGRYPQAVEHLMMAANILTTRIISGIVQDEENYRFSDLRDLLARIDRSGTLSEFATDTEFNRALYYLGVSLLGDGALNQAMEIFQDLSGSSGPWAVLARDKLKNPKIDKADVDPEF